MLRVTIGSTDVDDYTLSMKQFLDDGAQLPFQLDDHPGCLLLALTEVVNEAQKWVACACVGQTREAEQRYEVEPGALPCGEIIPVDFDAIVRPLYQVEITPFVSVTPDWYADAYAAEPATAAVPE